MLKEYRFGKRYEYNNCKDNLAEIYYRINGHKVSVDIFDIIFNKIQLTLSLDTTYETFWKNHKTGHYDRYQYWSFNEVTYDD